MSRWAYLGVLLVVLASVGFGLDWQPATLPPLPISKSAPAAVSGAVPGSKNDTPAAALAPAGFPSTAATVAPPPEQTMGAGPSRRSEAAGATVGAAPNCNVQACAAAYRSFLAADCSYQPLNGPRTGCSCLVYIT